MRLAIRPSKRGFTLIELMVVVAIVGILAVLAVYGVRAYIANAKTAEARNGLGQMGKDESAVFEQDLMKGDALPPRSSAGLSHSLCFAPTTPVPSDPGLIRGQKYQSNQNLGIDWRADEGTPLTGFACLRFTIDDPQYYMYNFASTNQNAAGGTWTATARGDLNGDGTLSTFTMSGVIQPTMTFSLAPNLKEDQPEE